MRGRLIVKSKIEPPFPQEVCFWPEHQPVPPGWELLELSEWSDDCARCGHSRLRHMLQRYGCMMLEDGLPCFCRKFLERDEVG